MKPLPIEKDNFKQLIEGNCYYVDKTLFMSMLYNFFEIDLKKKNIIKD